MKFYLEKINNQGTTTTTKDKYAQRFYDNYQKPNLEILKGRMLYDGGNYKQMPFESITEDQYWLMHSMLEKIDLTKVKELTDETDRQGEIACAGGKCEI